MAPISKEQMLRETILITESLPYLGPMAREDNKELRLHYLMRHIPMEWNIDIDNYTPIGAWSFKCKEHKPPQYYDYPRDYLETWGLESDEDFKQFVVIYPDGTRTDVMTLDEVIEKLTELHK